MILCRERLGGLLEYYYRKAALSCLTIRQKPPNNKAELAGLWPTSGCGELEVNVNLRTNPSGIPTANAYTDGLRMGGSKGESTLLGNACDFPDVQSVVVPRPACCRSLELFCHES